MTRAEGRWDAVSKPKKSLGDLEELIVRIAGAQRTENIDISPRAAVVFAADNGIVAERIAQSSPDLTAGVAAHIACGRGNINTMSRAAGCDVICVDVGIDSRYLPVRPREMVDLHVTDGTRSFLEGPAMTDEDARKAFGAGLYMADRISEKGIRIAAAGEMGIGNTTTSAAVIAALLDREPREIVGRGAGLDDAGLMRKRQVIAQGIDKYGFSQEAARSRDEEPAMTRDEVLRALSRLGGLDMAAMCGLYIGAACHRIPVIIDGAISAAAALTASMLIPGVSRYMVASHVGKEPAMPYLLEALGKSPVISADLALGEGTGAVMLIPLLEMALSVYRDGIHFSGLNMEPYRRYDAK
jgi:nicotinate-nucleotide--dimethylbenzimidazole phosphoribosyltransferase